MTLKFTQIVDKFIADLERQGATVMVLHDEGRRPAKLSVTFGDDRGSFELYAWNVTRGGGPGGERPQHERRIQITGASAFPTIVGRKGLLMGWSEEFEVWVAWDIARHREFSVKSPSLQVHSDTLETAFTNGAATQKRPSRQGDEVVVAVRPDFLAWYLFEGMPAHHYADEVEDFSDLANYEHEELREFVDSGASDAAVSRRSELVTLLRSFRNAAFRPQVLRAYSYKCAVCGVALRLVDAAHIVPVSEPGSTDEPDNGLALCALHHRAYDSGLLGISPKYRVFVSRTASERLAAINLDSGLQDFISDLPRQIALPTTVEVRPRPGYLQRGLEIRGAM